MADGVRVPGGACSADAAAALGSLCQGYPRDTVLPGGEPAIVYCGAMLDEGSPVVQINWWGVEGTFQTVSQSVPLSDCELSNEFGLTLAPSFYVALAILGVGWLLFRPRN